MFRTLGFVIGSLLSLAALVLLVGVPRFGGEHPVAIEPVEDPAPPLAPGPLPEPPAPRIAGNVPTEPSAEPEDPAAFAEAIAIEEIAAPAPEVESPRPAGETEWRTFWTPFRSRVAAEGFVGRLEALTGLDYRVAKEGIDRYHVQFAYRDEAELDSNLATISVATGLELAERSP